MGKGIICDNCSSMLSGFFMDVIRFKLNGFTVTGPLLTSTKYFCDKECLKEFYSPVVPLSKEEKGEDEEDERC